MVDISIIVPVYNAEKYLEECLDSIIKQNMHDIEIICVNDGSTDKSLQILQKYADFDGRVIVIDKENKGATSARNAGILVARGRYIGFVDSDDWIETNMYEELFQTAQKYQADMISSGYFMEGAYTSEHYDAIKPGCYRGKELSYIRKNTIYNMQEQDVGLRGALWCKLFKKEFIEKIHLAIPETLSFSEDKMCLLSCVLEAESIVVLRKAYYHYRINPASMVHSANLDYLSRINEVYKFINLLYKHENFTSSMRVQAELYITELLLKGINTRLGFQHRNLLWIDPSWLNRIPIGSKVVLYGGGELGVKYRTHLNGRKDLQYVTCIDFDYEKFVNSKALLVESPDVLAGLQYDYIVITIKNPNKAQQVRRQLGDIGIEEEKIVWYEQPEIFWKYVEADGLLNVAEEERVETREADNRQVSED